MNTNARPILLSTVQFERQLSSGAMTMLDVLRQARDLGAQGVELRPAHWPAMPHEAAAVRDEARRLGLACTFATFSTLFNADEAGHRSLLRDIEDARSVGARLLRVFQGPAPDFQERHKQRMWRGAEAAIESAGESGLSLALENAGGPPGASLVEMVLALEHLPGLLANLDIGNYAAQGQDAVQAIHVLGERIAATHLKDIGSDGVATALGEGTLPLDDILDAFDDLPHGLAHVFEFPGGDDPQAAIRKSMQRLRASPARA